MYPSRIAFMLASMCIIVAILRRQAKKKEDLVSEGIFLTIEIALVVFLWIFLGLSYEWW